MVPDVRPLPVEVSLVSVWKLGEHRVTQLKLVHLVLPGRIDFCKSNIHTDDLATVQYHRLCTLVMLAV
jgi:hypothetical protein